MTDLTAIDILVDPDDDTIRHARQWNARMRESVPTGFALDATHQPHITTLQRFVRTEDLDEVYTVVEQTLAATDVAALSYRAVAIGHGDWGVPGQGLAVIVIEPSPQVLDLQAALLAAVAPFTDSGGTAAAFVRDPGEEISQSTIDWVDGYVPSQFGAGNYVAHITVGFATLEDLERIEAEPFDAFPVHPAGLAIYHLGNSGSARGQLKEWPLTE
ncbi:2'-5' RNA ligase family protein [Solirubrobacter soli]|uniref:2'-5' RNA ligase family protein n=1 Tax=Solirubrobacter soli TaxID=363832 RepID=UPI00041ED24F|nr:2'-5' RNA ligase family protein [Solirubrobacter soli]